MKKELPPLERAELLARRTILVSEVLKLKAKAPGADAAPYLVRFYKEDLQDRAKKILAIDRRLGRIP